MRAPTIPPASRSCTFAGKRPARCHPGRRGTASSPRDGTPERHARDPEPTPPARRASQGRRARAAQPEGRGTRCRSRSRSGGSQCPDAGRGRRANAWEGRAATRACASRRGNRRRRRWQRGARRSQRPAPEPEEESCAERKRRRHDPHEHVDHHPPSPPPAGKTAAAAIRRPGSTRSGSGTRMCGRSLVCGAREMMPRAASNWRQTYRASARTAPRGNGGCAGSGVRGRATCRHTSR